MSDAALVALADNLNRLIDKPGGVYSSNDVAAKASQGAVSRSTLDRLRKADRVGATAVGIDKLEGVAKTFGVEVWQLFVPGLDIKNPPKLMLSTAKPWPFAKVDEAKVRSLSETDLARLEGAILHAADVVGLDIKKST